MLIGEWGSRIPGSQVVNKTGKHIRTDGSFASHTCCTYTVSGNVELLLFCIIHSFATVN